MRRSALGGLHKHIHKRVHLRNARLLVCACACKAIATREARVLEWARIQLVQVPLIKTKKPCKMWHFSYDARLIKKIVTLQQAGVGSATNRPINNGILFNVLIYIWVVHAWNTILFNYCCAHKDFIFLKVKHFCKMSSVKKRK